MANAADLSAHQSSHALVNSELATLFTACKFLSPSWMLVLCAGDSKEWEQLINLNVTAPLILTQAFAKGMADKKVTQPAWRIFLWPRICQVSGKLGRRHRCSYCG